MRLGIEVIDILVESVIETGVYKMQCETDRAMLVYEVKHLYDVEDNQYVCTIKIIEDGKEVDIAESNRISTEIEKDLVNNKIEGVFALIKSKEVVEKYFKDYLKNRSSIYSYKDAIYKYIKY